MNSCSNSLEVRPNRDFNDLQLTLPRMMYATNWIAVRVVLAMSLRYMRRRHVVPCAADHLQGCEWRCAERVPAGGLACLCAALAAAIPWSRLRRNRGCSNDDSQ